MQHEKHLFVNNYGAKAVESKAICGVQGWIVNVGCMAKDELERLVITSSKGDLHVQRLPVGG